jgi:hypothetical protein
MAISDPIKLTPIQRAVLQELATGAMLTVDVHNLLWLNGRVVQPNTRAVLMKHRLLRRFDMDHDIKAKGNGFVLSEKGRQVIAAL